MAALPYWDRYAVGWLSKLRSLLGTLNIRCHIIIGIQKGTIILTTAHMQFRVYLHPEVCKMMAFLAATVGFRAIFLHTCGGLEPRYGLKFRGFNVRG